MRRPKKPETPRDWVIWGLGLALLAVLLTSLYGLFVAAVLRGVR